MSAAIPQVAAMRVRFAAAAGALLAASVGVVYLGASAALPLGASDREGVLRLSVAAAFVAALTLLGASLLLFGGLSDVRRYAERGADGLAEGPSAERASDGPPAAAVEAAFHGPFRVTFAAALAVLGLVVLDALTGGAISRIGGPRRVAVDVLLFGVFQSGLLYVARAWRGLLWAWLSRLNPGDGTVPTRPSLARRYALRVASAFTLLGASVSSVPLAYLGSAQGLAQDASHFDSPGRLYVAGAVASVLLIGAVAVVLGWRIGCRIASDVRELDAYVRSLAGVRERWSSGTPALLPDARVGTSVARGIARSVRALSEKYAAMARQERRSRQAIEDMQRLKARFMAFMSHDLRSPLNAITGFADILADEVDGPLSTEQRKSVQAIRESGQVLLRLVTDIVDTARIEAGRLLLGREAVELWALAEEAVARVRGQVGDPGPRFDLSFETASPMVHVDRERVLQALVGVLAHVARMAPEGTICVAGSMAVAPGGGFVARLQVEAEDLPPEDTQRIFVAFREIKRPSGRRVGGLGLGLALARTLIVAHGGELHYESSGPGGASFTFELPVGDES